MVIIQDIVRQHPESAALVFLKYGINSPVNERTLSAAIISNGEPFVNDLSAAVANSYEYSSGLFGLGKKKKEKKAQKKAAAQQNANVAAAATGTLPPRMANVPVELLSSRLNEDIAAELRPQSQAAQQMAVQTRQQILNTNVSGGGNIWSKIGDIIGGIKGVTGDIAAIRNPQRTAGNGGTSGGGDYGLDDTGGGAGTPQDEKPFKTWMIAAAVAVVVLIIIVAATSGGAKTVAK